jgi:hypothetical protein
MKAVTASPRSGFWVEKPHQKQASTELRHVEATTRRPPNSLPTPTMIELPRSSAQSSASTNATRHFSGGVESGIDIRDALSILSNRARGGADADTVAYSGGTVLPPPELKEMGQMIDMIINPKTNDDININNSKVSGCGCIRSNTNDDDQTPHSPVDEDELERHELLKKERARRGEEIRAQLRSMSVVDLLGMIFRAQEERVATYHVFEQ